ncbi:MAG: tetratricopeptide repeat protein [Pseudomonadota bacterium]
MGAVTYPTPAVVDFLNLEVIPLKLTPDSEPQASDFWVRWTPAMFVLDPFGNPHHTMIGFVPPEQFLPHLLLGKALSLFAHRRFNDALANLERILEDHAQSFAAPQAVYYRAICRYRTSHDASHLRIGHQILAAEYQGSEWVGRTQPYLLIK